MMDQPETSREGAPDPDRSIPTKSVRTPVLEIAYEEWGEADGRVVVLLHGFPDDARSWEAVAVGLAAAGYRVLAPYLRGFGPTRFLDEDTPRSGQTAALAQDLLDFADALGLGRLVLVGHDWGASAAQAVAALHPERVEHLVSFMGYSIAWDTGAGPPSYAQLHALWYQYLLNAEEGAYLLASDRRGFCRYLWDAWSPTWQVPAEDFGVTAASFDNADFVDVVVNAYRDGRRDDAARDPRYDELAAQLAAGPDVPVPAIVVQGADDGLEPDGPAPETLEEARFTGGYRRQMLEGVGHFPHRERPEAVIAAVLAGPSGRRRRTAVAG